MRTQTIVHVGPHKTGSTALQLAFHDGQDALARSGVCYARTGRRGHAQFDLIEWARNRHDLDPAALRAEAEDAATLLISCENVVHLNEQAQIRLRDALPADRPVRVVYYLRRLIDVWVSHWRELNKHGLPMSITDYLAQQTALRPQPNLRIDQVEQVRLLTEVFGREAVEVVGYDAAREQEGGIVADFVRSVLGLDAETTGLAPRTANVAEPHARMELVRLINRIHLDVERRPATQELRIAVFNALGAGEVPFMARFAAVVTERSRPLVIPRSDVAIMRQRHFVRLFGDLVTDGQPAIDAYLKLEPRTVKAFDFPMTGEDALLAEIVEFYRSLPGKARLSAGQR